MKLKDNNFNHQIQTTMKKALMFVGLAMFASMAYAQTETASRAAKASIQQIGRAHV